MDNGIMIAWNGIERWNVNKGVLRDREEIENVNIRSRAPLGENWTQLVSDANLKCGTIKKKELYSS